MDFNRRGLNVVWKKILLFSIVLISLISGVFGVLSNDVDIKADWELEDLTDSSGNGNTLTNFGATPTSLNCNTGDCYDFVTNDEMDTGIDLSTLTEWSIEVWVDIDTEASDYGIWTTRGGNGCTLIMDVSANGLNVQCHNSGGGLIYYVTTTKDLQTAGWTHIVTTFNDTSNEMRLFVDGSLVSTDLTGGTIFHNNNLKLGKFFTASGYMDGRLDDVRLYKRQLSSSDINDLFINNLIRVLTPTINHNVSSYYTNSNISIGLNTSSNVNMSYYLDGGIKTSIANDINLTTLNLFSLSDGLHNITFNALDSLGQTNTSTNFTIDTILPVITNNINSTITDYLFNADFSCTDTNLFSCNISINGFNKVNNSIFTLNNNGNLSYNLTAIDLAGNQLIETGILFVNPFQIFKFNDTTLNLLVSSFTFGGISSIGNQVKIPTYNSVLSLGSNVLEFFKFGYNIQNFTININTTSDINQTYDITPTTLVIKVFDSTSITTQLTFNITIINSSASQIFTNQVNFSKRFNETLGGAINLVIESNGYSTGYFFNTLNQDTTLNINSYLTPINQSSTIRFFVADSAQASVGLVGVLIELQKLINGSYVTIQQGMTGDSGESFIQTDASESYLFIFSKSGFVSATAQSIPNILDYSVTLSLVSQVFTYIDDISFSFTPIETILDYNQSINFTGFISGTSFSFTQFNIYNSTNDLIYRQNSTNPTGTSFIKQISISNTTTEITTEIVYIVEGITKTTSKTYTIKAITGFIKTAKDYSEDETFTAKFIRFLVIMILVVSSLAITRTESIQEISLFVVPVYVFLSYINFIPWTQAAALSMLAIIFFIGGKR